MRSGKPRADLGEALRSAYAPGTGCPPPEVFLELADLPPEERRRLEEHADGCPACSAERDLARLFDAGPGEAAAQQEDVDWVVSRLRSHAAKTSGRAPETRPEPNVVPFRRRAPLFAPRWLAAAAVLLLGVGLFLRQQTSPPALPDPGTGTVLRGSELAVVAPRGELAEMPAELRWEEVAGARSYRVALRGVDDTVLWESTVSGSPARLPAEILERLHPAVVYRWSVEAVDEQGALRARSEPVEFRVRPPREGRASRGVASGLPRR